MSKRKRYKRLNKKEARQILTLANEQIPFRKIATVTGRGMSTISYLAKAGSFAGYKRRLREVYERQTLSKGSKTSDKADSKADGGTDGRTSGKISKQTSKQKDGGLQTHLIVKAVDRLTYSVNRLVEAWKAPRGKGRAL